MAHVGKTPTKSQPPQLDMKATLAPANGAGGGFHSACMMMLAPSEAFPASQGSEDGEGGRRGGVGVPSTARYEEWLIAALPVWGWGEGTPSLFPVHSWGLSLSLPYDALCTQ